MEQKEVIIKYPENKPYRVEVFRLNLKLEDLAIEIGCSRVWLSRVLAGHEKGKTAIKQLKDIIKKNGGEVNP